MTITFKLNGLQTNKMLFFDRLCNDILYELSLRLGDSDLLNLCQIVPKIIRLDPLWCERFLRSYGRTPLPVKRWYDYYRETTYIFRDICRLDVTLSRDDPSKRCRMILSEEDLSDVSYFAGSRCAWDVINFITNLYPNNISYAKIIEGASRKGNLEIVKTIFERSERNCNLNIALANSATGPHYELIEYLIENGANNYSFALIGSAESGDHQLFDHFLQRCPLTQKVLNSSMTAAVRNKDVELVKRLARLGADDWNDGLSEAILYEDLELVQWFLDQGADDFYEAIYWSDFSKIPGYSETIISLLQKYI